VPRRDWKLRLEDIIQSIRKIQEYTKDLDYDAFTNDAKTKDAVLSNFMIIGDAVKYIPDKVIDDHPEIAWHEMRGIRNIIAHGYFQVDDKIIWDAIQTDLVDLLPKMIDLRAKI
jgi:uncharacterized protein with HEPN domain